jgi:hypothetical protein
VIEGYPKEPEGDRIDQISANVGNVRLFEAHGLERVLRSCPATARERVAGGPWSRATLSGYGPRRVPCPGAAGRVT